LDATVHYPFHPHYNRTFKILQRSGSVSSQVILEASPGKTFTVPLWMIDPAARELGLSLPVVIDSSVYLSIVALLETNCFAEQIFCAVETTDGPTTP